MEIQSAKLIITVVDETTGELITREATLGDFKEVNVMVSSGEIGAPCFVCRQMISELFEEDCIIRCYSTKGDYKEDTVKELCPYPFGEDDLK